MNRILYFWLIALFVKLGLSAWLPFSADESYYWVWSHHPQLSYFDHPPMVAWLYTLGQPLENFFRAVRWPGVIAVHLSLLVWLRVLKDFLSPPQATLWLALMLFAPLTGPGSLLITPDSPLLLFWPLALLCLRNLVEGQQLKWAVTLGVAVGLGFSGKYVMAFFVPLALLWLWYEKVPAAKVIRWLPAALLGFFLASAPVWIWNFQNNFISFLFQLQHGLGRPKWKPSWTYEYFLVQMALIFPVVLWYALRAKAPRWAKIFAWGPLIIFAVTSLRGYVEANWPIVAHPLVFALAASTAPRSSRLLRGTIVIWGTLLVVILGQLAWGWLPINSSATKLRELTAYDHLIESARPLEPLFARSYQVASKLSFELKRPVYKLKGMNRTDFYDFRPESSPAPGRYFLAIEPGDSLPEEWKRAGHRIAREIPVDQGFTIWEVEAP